MGREFLKSFPFPLSRPHARAGYGRSAPSIASEKRAGSRRCQPLLSGPTHVAANFFLARLIALVPFSRSATRVSSLHALVQRAAP